MGTVVGRALVVVGALLAISGVGVSADGSPVAETGRDVAVVEPSACLVEPRSDLDSLSNPTPAAPVFPESEADLPQGEPASQEVTDIVVAIEREFAACLNDADVPRASALLTDDAAARLLADVNADQNQPAGVATPDPALNDVRLTLLAVRDVRVLDDGRLGAVVVWVLERSGDMAESGPDLETNFHIYEEVDGQWLLSEELSGFIREMRIEPVDGGWLLDEDVLGTPYVYETEGTPAA